MDNSIKKDSVNDSSCRYLFNLAQKSIISEIQNFIDICSRKLEQDPKHVKALLLRASSYIKTNDFDLAFEDAKALVEIDANNSYNHYLTGCILEKLNKIEEAILSFDKAMEIDENNVNALFSRGACYNKLGNFVKSIEDYNLAIEMDSKQFYKRTSYKNLDKVLEINGALNECNTIPSSIHYTENNNDFLDSILITDNSSTNSKNNRIENTFTPITKDKKKQVFKFFNSIKKNKDLPPKNLKVKVAENPTLTQCKSNFSKKDSVKKNMGIKRNSDRHFNYNINYLTNVQKPIENKDNINENNDQIKQIMNLKQQLTPKTNNISSKAVVITNITQNKAKTKLTKKDSLKKDEEKKIESRNFKKNTLNVESNNKLLSPITKFTKERDSSTANSIITKLRGTATRGHTTSFTENSMEAILDSIPSESKSKNEYELYFNLGYDERMKENYPKAIEHYTKSIELNPTFFKAYFNRGFVFNKIERYHSAVGDYTKAVELEPQNPYTYFNRAIAYEKLNDFEKAIEDLSFSIKIMPNKVEFFLKRAYLLKKLRAYETCIKDYSNVLKIEPTNPKALFNRGICYEIISMYSEAEKDFDSVLCQEKNCVAYLFHLASVQEKLGSEDKRQDAFKHYNSIIQIDPKFAPAYNGIAVIFDKLQKFEDSIKFFNTALELDNSNALFWNNRGCAYRNTANYELSIKDFNKSIELDPTNMLYYDNRAQCWKKMENYSKAIEDYNFILSSQIDIKTLVNRAFCFAKINQFEKSIMDYTKILELEKKNTHALYNRALSFEKLNKYKDAIDDFTYIIEIDPMNANAYLNRGCCYEKINKVDLAYKDYEASLLIDKILEMKNNNVKK